MKEKRGLGKILLNVAREKCPNCGKGEVFEKKKHLLEFPNMKKNCPVCNYRFEREPGFFLGAMYLSYALAVLQAGITFLLLYFLAPDLPTIVIPLAIMAVVILFSYKNYKWSRLLYIYIFPW